MVVTCIATGIAAILFFGLVLKKRRRRLKTEKKVMQQVGEENKRILLLLMIKQDKSGRHNVSLPLFLFVITITACCIFNLDFQQFKFEVGEFESILNKS